VLAAGAVVLLARPPGAEAAHQFAGQGSGPAPDVERTLASHDSGGVGDQWGEEHGIPAHEGVVGVTPGAEGSRSVDFCHDSSSRVWSPW